MVPPAGPLAAVEVRGDLEDWLAAGPALEAETRFREALAASRDRDGVTGGAALGPHRSDLAVTHAGGLPAAQCSTGEQKALLLVLIEADVRLVTAATGRAPLVLLDEVAAHLDAERRAALLDAVLALGTQVWATGTDRAAFRDLDGRAGFYSVAAGRIVSA